MQQVSFLRQDQFFSPVDTNDETLNIIGVGATGSNIGLSAAKMGWTKYRIWDADRVESHNLPNQIYNQNQIGEYKVDAFEKQLQDFNNSIQVEKHNCFFKTEEHKNLLNGPLILTVDTLEARKDIFSSFHLNTKVPYVFETAMGFEHATISYLPLFEPTKQKEWFSNLKNDSEVEEGPCNARIISTLTGVVSNITVHYLCNIYSSKRRLEGITSLEIPKKTIINTSNEITVNFSIFNISN